MVEWSAGQGIEENETELPTFTASVGAYEADVIPADPRGETWTWFAGKRDRRGAFREKKRGKRHPSAEAAKLEAAHWLAKRVPTDPDEGRGIFDIIADIGTLLRK